MTNCVRTNTRDIIFNTLVEQLDKDLWNRYPEMQAQYATFAQVGPDLPAVIAEDKGVPVGCGCFREYNNETVEIKRMYVKPGYRDKGIAIAILHELEKWAFEKGYKKAILETGMRQPEAIALYAKNGYALMDNFGPYAKLSDSVCMEKEIKR